MMHQFMKLRFTTRDRSQATAGLVVACDKVRGMPVTGVSRLFPYSEAAKMQRLQLSPAYETWEEAFSYKFDT